MQPASAAPVCAKGKLCTWTGANFSGTRHDRTTSAGHGCFAPGVGTSFRTISNQSGRAVTVYSDTGCYGSTVVIKNGQYSESLPFAAKSLSW
ncbi:peptidase inhibitor family I36 protein [Streptomyces pseudogriseolus]|uniref:peptidase inhibitor family I36 protein n=1 Tax=Streptomyces pseudogriseolus TaxID=36817 RepID=UPI0035AB938E